MKIIGLFMVERFLCSAVHEYQLRDMAKSNFKQ